MLGRQKDRLFRREDGCGLGHEIHAAEDDDIGLLLCGGPGELKRIPGDIRDILDFGNLVVVRKNDRVVILLKPQNLLPDPVCFLHRSKLLYPILHIVLSNRRWGGGPGYL
jgi:hypothetical protein